MAPVQTKAAAGNGATLSFSLDAGTTAGGYLVVLAVALGTVASPSALTCTIGGTSLTAVESSFNPGGNGSVSILELPNVAAGQTAIAISTTGGSGSGQGIFAYAYELPGMGASSTFDKGTAAQPSGTAWSSGSTAATAQASETWIGIGESLQSGAAVGQTGPGSPWVNLAVQQLTLGTFSGGAISGWQDVSATGAAAYAGTASRSAFSIAAVGTWKTTPPSPPAPAASQAAPMPRSPLGRRALVGKNGQSGGGIGSRASTPLGALAAPRRVQLFPPRPTRAVAGRARTGSGIAAGPNAAVAASAYQRPPAFRPGPRPPRAAWRGGTGANAALAPSAYRRAPALPRSPAQRRAVWHAITGVSAPAAVQARQVAPSWTRGQRRPQRAVWHRAIGLANKAHQAYQVPPPPKSPPPRRASWRGTQQAGGIRAPISPAIGHPAVAAAVTGKASVS